MKNLNKVNDARSTRMLVYFSLAQRKALRTLAKRSGTSQQELIRRGIDLVLARKAS